jgi:hypothetical protein
VGDQLFRGCAVAGPEHDERLRALALLLVGHPDDRRVQDGRAAHADRS